MDSPKDDLIDETLRSRFSSFSPPRRYKKEIPSPEQQRLLGTHFATHPLSQRWLQKLLAGSNRVQTPDDVLGELLTIQSTLLLGGEIRAFSTSDIPEHMAAWTTAILLGRAVPFLWLNRIREAVAHTKVSGDCQIVRELLPFDKMWWTWETDVGDDKVDSMGVLLLRHEDVLAVVGLLKHSTGQKSFSLMALIPFGTRFSELSSQQQKNISPLLSMLAFVNSPYVCRESRKASRSVRREEKRKQHEYREEREVHFVDLRRAKEPSQAAHQTDRDWSFRWIVRGHVRNQFYPADQSHRPIWIAPYVKGPGDKPVKPAVYRVLR